MASSGFALFETAIGSCGVAWGERGIVRVGLPESSDDATRARINRKLPGILEAAPPPPIVQAIHDMTTLLDGEPVDLSAVVVDLADVPAFNQQVYEIARTIPPGQTLTYGDIARRLGDVSLSRDVGQALGQNPVPIVVPCHRVVAANGKTGGFSARGGVATKIRMLAIERATIKDSQGNETPTLFDVPLSVAPARRRG